MLNPRTEAFGAIFGVLPTCRQRYDFFGILDRLKAKYIFSGALLLLFLLPVLGMALPGGVQHPATPERQTPPDSTPTQAVQKSRRETRREIRRLQREADRPPDRRNTYGRGAGFAFRHQDRLDLRSASPLADRPRRQYGSHRQRLAATRFVASGHDPARYDPEKNLSWTTSSAAKTRTRSTTTYATARSISTTRAISTTRT